MEPSNESPVPPDEPPKPRVGRRSRKPEHPAFGEETQQGDDSSTSNANKEPSAGSSGAETSTTAAPPSPGPNDSSEQKNGGDESVQNRRFTGVSRRKQTQMAEQILEGGKNKKKYDEEAEPDIMEIPELDEEGQEDITRVVADAPKVRAQKVQDIAELEEASPFHLPGSDDRDIELSLLTSCLCSLEQVTESDEIWDPDQLFSQIASDLNAERDKLLGEGEGGEKVSIAG